MRDNTLPNLGAMLFSTHLYYSTLLPQHWLWDMKELTKASYREKRKTTRASNFTVLNFATESPGEVASALALGRRNLHYFHTFITLLPRSPFEGPKLKRWQKAICKVSSSIAKSWKGQRSHCATSHFTLSNLFSTSTVTLGNSIIISYLISERSKN